MRHVAPADIQTLPTLREIEASLKPAVRVLIAPARPSIELAYSQYETATPEALHTLTPLGVSKQVGGALETIFSRRLGHFRKLYNDLTRHFEATFESTCPYCNLGEQWEHDHYLPKSVYPEFALYPSNLVPICKSCNGKKLARYQLPGGRLFVHAYSELEGVENLLHAQVVYNPNIAVSYSLRKPSSMIGGTFGVIERHFVVLDLGRRYTRQASTTIARLVRRLRTPESLGLGPRQLRRRLRRMADDRSAQCPPNHWEVSLLNALAESADFTNHIFR